MKHFAIAMVLNKTLFHACLRYDCSWRRKRKRRKGACLECGVEGVCSDDDSDEEEDENDNSNNNNNTIPPVLALRPGPGPRLDALALEGL